MFIGQYINKLTSKNRAALPSKFRSELGNELIIAKWYEDCLIIVKKESWIELLNKLTGKSEILIKPVRDTDRFIFGSAFELNPDSQGRILIPKILLEFANIKSDIVFLGLGGRIELWDLNMWESKNRLIQKKASDYLEEMAKSK